MKNGPLAFTVTMTVAKGLDGVMRASIRSGTDEFPDVASHRWEWPQGRLTIGQLNDIAAAMQDVTYREILTRYGSQGSLGV